MKIMKKRIATSICFILLLYLLPVSAFAAETEYAAIIDPVAQEMIGKTVPGACVVISERGKIVFSRGYGLSDIKHSNLMVPEETVFEWGSISKTFVWVSVMQLVEKDKLDLAEDIRKYLPEGFLKNLRYEEPITLLHLMNHTAGFEEQMLDLRFYQPEDEIPLYSVMAEHQPKQVFRPGEVCAYSNWGAALAALIIERVSGQNYRDYITDNILKPLEMNNTSVGPFWEDVPGLTEAKATGYSLVSSGFREEPPMHLQMYPAGAMNGSVADLLKYAQELAKAPGQETVLFQRPETKEKMFEETWRSYGANAGLSHGFWQYAGNDRTFGHEGGTYGFKTQFWVQPDRDRVILILTNVMETEFCSGIMEVLVSSESAPPDFAEKKINLSVYTGSYIPARSVWSNIGKIHGRMQIITIAETEGDRLKLTMPFGNKELIYTALGSDCFYCAEAAPEEQMLAFSMENGSVKTMSFRLAHDYIPAPTGQNLAFTLLSAALFLATLIFWLVILTREIWKIAKRKQRTTLCFLLPAAMIIMDISCVIGLLRWFSLYTIISAELNAVVGICWGCILIGGAIQIVELIRKKKVQVPLLLIYLLQVLATAQLGFMAAV